MRRLVIVKSYHAGFAPGESEESTADWIEIPLPSSPNASIGDPQKNKPRIITDPHGFLLKPVGLIVRYFYFGTVLRRAAMDQKI
jgi:hypothetical protein